MSCDECFDPCQDESDFVEHYREVEAARTDERGTTVAYLRLLARDADAGNIPASLQYTQDERDTISAAFLTAAEFIEKGAHILAKDTGAARTSTPENVTPKETP